MNNFMRRVILVTNKTLADIDQMKDIFVEAASKGHGGMLCASGYSLEFQLEEDAITYLNQPDIEVLKIDPQSGKLVPAEKK
jgi:hypothetical protein